MKALVILLIAAMLFMQYKLWFAKGNVNDMINMQHSVNNQLKQNQMQKIKNQQLEEQIKDLKDNQQALEELARRQHGMIKPGEKYYRFS